MIRQFFVNPFFRFLFLAFVLFCLIVIVREGTGIKERISNIVFETYIISNPRPASGKLVFVDIDDLSLSTSQAQWPWPRTDIAQVIKNINNSGAEVIVFDGVLAEPDRTSPESLWPLLEEGHPARDQLRSMPSNDVALADEIERAGNFVAGFSRGSNTTPPMLKQNILVRSDTKNVFLQHSEVKFNTTAQFLPELQKSAAGNGSFIASPDRDAVIRRTGLLFHDGNQIYPSLILEALRLYGEKGRNLVKISENDDYAHRAIAEPYTISVGDYKIPINATGKMWVYFRPFTEEENISAYKFLDSHYNRDNLPNLSGKIVFIASSAEGLMDLRSTPLGFQPGVRVHMNALEQILQNNYLVRPDSAEGVEVVAVVVASLIIVVLSFFINPAWLAFLVALLTAGVFWSSWHLFEHYGGLFDPVTPSLIMILVSMAATILSYLKTDIDRQQVRDAFGHYISPDFMKELTNNPDKLKLGGEIRELTVMFTDIRRFTTISEGLTPEELIQLMNDFLTPMSDLVMKNRGTIDKYMGDAMMAFWNAPLDDPEHAFNACTAALKMQEALEPINEQVKVQAEEKGKIPVLLQAGIGVNTGPCAVGNMGSRQRFAYSTLGDAVNLASRLEGQTKTYGVGILVGEPTYLLAPQLAFLELDLLQVKGKSKPVRVFALLGDEEFAASKGFVAWKEKHEDMLEKYRTQNFEQARKTIQKCRHLSEDTLSITYDLYEERIKDLLQEPPGAEWDGVFIATSK